MAPVERGRPRDPRNDTVILDATLDLLIERGTAGVGMEAVARRAGVGKMTVYRRWKSKDDLLMSALEHARHGPDDAAATLEELIVATATLLSEDRFRLLTARILGDSPDHPDLMATYTERYLQPRRNRLVRAIQHSIEVGELPIGTDPVVIEDAFTGTIGIVLVDPRAAPVIEDRLRATLTRLGYRRNNSADAPDR